MDGRLLLAELKKQFPDSSTSELALMLGKSPVQLSQMKKQEVKPIMVARLVKRLSDQIVRGSSLVPEIKRKFGVATDSSAAKLLGMTQPALATWRKRASGVTARQIGNALAAARKAGAASAHASAFQPIIEMFPVTPVQKKKTYDVFSDGNGNKQRAGLKQELLSSRGIYIFYDARGKALYAGKARDQSIWKEMNLAFNRNRAAQRILAVKHPTNNVKYTAAHERVRQPVETPRKLSDLATYFSAYTVAPDLIDDFEALFIRAFPNDLLNFRVEKLGKRRKTRSRHRGGSAKT